MVDSFIMVDMIASNERLFSDLPAVLIEFNLIHFR